MCPQPICLPAGTTAGQDLNLSMDRLMSSRNFTNKLWNAGKFILFNLEQLDDEEWSGLALADFSSPGALEQLPLAERWVVSALHQVSQPQQKLSPPQHVFNPFHKYCVPAANVQNSLASSACLIQHEGFELHHKIWPRPKVMLCPLHIAPVLCGVKSGTVISPAGQGHMEFAPTTQGPPALRG